MTTINPITYIQAADEPNNPQKPEPKEQNQPSPSVFWDFDESVNNGVSVKKKGGGLNTAMKASAFTTAGIFGLSGISKLASMLVKNKIAANILSKTGLFGALAGVVSLLVYSILSTSRVKKLNKDFCIFAGIQKPETEPEIKKEERVEEKPAAEDKKAEDKKVEDKKVEDKKVEDEKPAEQVKPKENLTAEKAKDMLKKLSENLAKLKKELGDKAEPEFFANFEEQIKKYTRQYNLIIEQEQLKLANKPRVVHPATEKPSEEKPTMIVEKGLKKLEQIQQELQQMFPDYESLKGKIKELSIRLQKDE